MARVPDESGTVGRIASLNLSRGGVPKTSVPEVRVTPDGLDGDRQRDRRLHGGPMRALCIYSMECIRALQDEGHPIVPGGIGENVTIEGIDWDRVMPGARLRLGEVEIEVTSFTVPCKTIRGAFADGKFIRVSQELHPGWSRVYARVLAAGHLREGDEVRLVPAR